MSTCTSGRLSATTIKQHKGRENRTAAPNQNREKGRSHLMRQLQATVAIKLRQRVDTHNSRSNLDMHMRAT